MKQVPDLTADVTAANSWDRVAKAPRPSWYLDPLVARQKQEAHLALVDRWSRGGAPLILKTDLFEEAYGADQLLFELGSRCAAAMAFDISVQTVVRAKANCPDSRSCHFFVTDLRDIGLASNSTDLNISNSTLDHFETEADFRRALSELVRILRPGGQLIITVDNTLNPLYWPLRWFGHSHWAPFPLG